MSSSSCPQIADRRRAFSRADFMVVLFLVTIAIFLSLPGIFTARIDHTKLRCINNLHEIGSAHHAFVTGNKGDANKLQSSNTGWRAQIREFLGSGSMAFKCPNEELPTGIRLPEAKIYVREGLWADRTGIFIPLSENGARMRVSKTVRPSFQFELEIDCSWPPGGRWNDLVIGVQTQVDGGVKITALSAISSPYYFDLYDNYGQLLIYDFRPSNLTNTYTFSPDSPGLGAFSYGANPAARYFSTVDDGSKVLVSEYKKPVCSVLNTERWQRLQATDFWPDDCAPRHNGKLNVLFMNGTVKTLYPRDIDPRRPALANEYWIPMALLPAAAPDGKWHPPQ